MRRWLVRIGIALLALGVVLAALWGFSRLRGPSAEQRAALALFEQIPEPSGRNAWPLAWLLQWDVPFAELERVAAEDAARFAALSPPGDAAREPAVAAFQSVAVERYRDLAPLLADEPASCGLRESGCLAHVRSDRQAHAERLAAAVELVDRVEALADYDHMYRPLPPALDELYPRALGLGLAKTRHALWFVDGEHDRALAGSCRAIAGQRRLATHADMLLFSMSAVSALEGQTALLAEMLAELPAEHALPPDCGQALAPLQPHELGICQAMHGEWQLGASAMAWIQPSPSAAQRLQMKLVYDQEATDARRAGYLAWPCSEEAERLRAQDLPVQVPETPGSLGRVECWANLLGCILSDIAAPAYVPYESRAQDAAARIRLLQALVWMRGQVADGDTRDTRALLAASPQLPRGGPRSIEVDEDGTGLRMSLFNQQRETHWAIPLPPQLHVPAATAGSGH